MTPFSFTKILFVFSVFSVISISNADDPYALVNQVCSKQGDANFCLTVLKADNRSEFAKDVKFLATVAVDAATKNSTATQDFFRGMKSGPPGVLKSLQDCIAAYETAITDFKVCMKEEDCDLTSYDIHDAGDSVKRCQSIVDGNGAHDSVITTSNNVTLEFCALAESLANQMCGK